ncbi:uncharacterized protein LOC121871071 [Homarus americanus]|uniref:Selenocysteine insertion sequence-binding protein 2-like n=1 Tax=Homarus americanus TaxID=6706 RepID=A0A8J5K080_HOMAM|nr:uncharacterized protein LOC121871071 [Homarus americanus]XP_042229121.1 uncharacterized protein LOC121871071 [Homarus americanus]KAG7165108.1 Selenocysteine insertion sequence-binding protein 2-like [Homarus americanus]
MLSPDVPEFIPRQFQTPNENNFGVDVKDTKYAPAKHVGHGSLDSSSVHGSPHQSPSPRHSYSSGHLTWRSAPRSASPRGRGEISGRSKYNRHRNFARGLSNGEAHQYESNSRHTSQRTDNWRHGWRTRGSPPEETNRSAPGIKKTDFSLSLGEAQSEKYQQYNDNPRKGRGGSQKRHNGEHGTGNTINSTVRDEMQHVQIPSATTATTHRRVDLSYKTILQGDNNGGTLLPSKTVAVSEMSVLQEDQWPTLNNIRPQTVPWVKRDSESYTPTGENNAWLVKKNDVPEASGFNKHIKKNRSSAEENNNPEIDHEIKVLGCDKVHKDVEQENNYNKGRRNEIGTLEKNNKTKNKTSTSQQHISLSAKNLPDKREFAAGEADLENCENSVQGENRSDRTSIMGKADPFQWQVKGERKKQTKNKNSSQQTEGISVPVKNVFPKGTFKRDRGFKPDSFGPSVRNRIPVLKEETGRYKKDDTANTSQVNKDSTSNVGSKKDSKVKNEFVKKSDDKTKLFLQEKANRKGSQSRHEQVQQDNAQFRVSSGSEQHDTNEIPPLAEGAKAPFSEPQKKAISEKDVLRFQELRRKRKDEKMRKKEQKLKKAQDLIKSDSKVQIITKEFLESVLAGGSSIRKSTNLFASDSRNMNSNSEDYSKVPKVKILTKNFTDSTLADSSRGISANLLSSDSQDRELNFISEEYPSLTSWGTTATRATSHENIEKKALMGSRGQSEALRESRVNSVKANTCLPSTSGSKVNNSEGVSDTPSDVPSYSGALLAAKNVVEKKPAPLKVHVRENVPSEATSTPVQKKKVKTKDLIEFDLMAAALKSKKNKRKDPTNNEENTTEALNRKAAGTLENYLGSPGKNTRSATAPSLITKVKGVTNMKRGKQREGKTKKKVSRLKKCMQRARQMEVEAFLSILQELSAGVEKEKSGTSVTESPHPETNGELKMTVATSGIVPEDVLSKDEGNVLENAHAKDDVNKVNAEQKLNPLTNISPELEHSEGNNSKNVSAAVNVCELSKDALDVEGECEMQANLKKNEEISKSHSVVKERERLKKELQSLAGITNTPCITVSSSTEVKLKQPDLHEKTVAEEVVPLVQNSTYHCDDPEKSKKFSIITEELRALHHPIHKKKFREYCDHIITPEVNMVTQQLVESLVGFQDRHFQRDPTKARIRRRYVCGLKETTKLMGKMSCIIVAPDIQRSKGPGALDEVVEKMLGQAQVHGVPVIFALSCKQIGNLCFKKVPVSCFGIINYQGAQDKFQTLMQLVPEAKKQYQELIACGSRSVPVDDEEPVNSERESPSLDISKEIIANTSSLIKGTAEG